MARSAPHHRALPPLWRYKGPTYGLLNDGYPNVDMANLAKLGEVVYV